jgi:hypothetical protein
MMILRYDIGYAQFSPGDLTRPHQFLDGTQNCTKCHEVGKEISGAKCLGCHEEIKQQFDAKHGFHYWQLPKQCVSCHKEHLGINAKTMLFDEQNYDHTQTGFTLTGKHASIACAECHSEKFMRDSIDLRAIAKHPHKSFLGLQSACASCHTDPHKGQFKQECASCHSTTTWTVKKFDHSKTHFSLEGKHISVSCQKCHTSLIAGKTTSTANFATQSFSDCTPCHASPHKSKFTESTCTACHTAQGWEESLHRPFDHTKTKYKLIGRHSSVRCEQCHRTTLGTTFITKYLLAFKNCADCHEDKHKGEFKAKYNNNCASCHSEYGFTPATFTLAKHAETKFPLAGAHIAVVCARCHVKGDEKALQFHFPRLTCESCHKDVHHGQFAEKMKDKGCETCHSTDRWDITTFDHSTTKFPLVGKHTSVSCSKCHKESNGNTTVQFRSVSMECESCHRDQHEKQFAKNGTTDCNQCHTTGGWKTITFNHETQSTFSLKGAHQKVTCVSCHREESVGNRRFVRYTPISAKCESCHQQGGLK